MIESLYPLSPLQQGMLFHALMAPGAGVDVQQIVITLRHSLNIPVLERAWTQLVSRHAVLRTRFKWEGIVEPQQEVLEAVESPLVQIDLCGLAPQEQQSRLDEFLQADRRHGFDLCQAPLLRLTLFKRDTDDHVLVWTFHHILIDGRSQVILLQELWNLYEAFALGHNLELPLPRPYGDYIDWVHRQDWTGAEPFWKQRLAGFRALTLLPMTHAQPPGEEGESKHSYRELVSNELTVVLQELARRYQVTLHTLVQGAWAFLLSRYTGQEDIVFGATRACRRSALGGVGTESMVGLFINTLPVRVRVSRGAELGPWLRELRAQWLAIRPYEHTPLSRVQEWSEVPHGSSLFQSIEVFENFHLNSLLRGQGGEWLNRTFTYIGQTNYPLTLLGFGDTPLRLAFQYYRPPFQEAGIDRILGHMETLLKGMVEHPDARLGDLPYLAPQERRRLLVQWNDAGAPRLNERCWHHLFEEQAARTPGAVAVRYLNQSLTYAELDAAANRWARHLATLGIGPDVIVGLCAERSLEMLVGLLAIQKVGAAFLPLDPSYPDGRLALMLDRSGARVLLTQQRLARRFESTARTVICLDAIMDWDEASSARFDGHADLQSLAYLIYTSGSTGEPKGVMIPHLGLVNYLTWANEYYRIEEGQGAPVHSSIGFDLTITSLLAPLLAGRTVVMLPEGEGLEALANCLRHEKDFSLVKATPSHLEILRHELTPSDVRGSAQVLIIGGEALTGEMLRFWQESAPETRLINEYGPTETVVGCSVYEASPGTCLSGMVPIGRPIANTRMYILDQEQRLVPVGILGELYVGGDGVARGYLGRADLTAERFVPDPFGTVPGARLYRTGDLARYLPDGNIEYIGRTDSQVKLRGYRIELGEIEAAIQAYPGIRQAAAALLKEDNGGRLIGYYVTEMDGAVSPADLVDRLKSWLPRYMVPAALVKLDALPLSENGKVERSALPVPETSQPDVKHRTPENEIEQLLAGVWAELFGIQKIGIDDDFFALGGHSLLATQLISRVRHAFLVDVPLRLIFDAPTIAALARALVARETKPGRTMTIARLRLKMGVLSPNERQALAARMMKRDE